MRVMPVSVLYTRADSVYKTLGVDCWDMIRDARLFPGGNPVVAHPPCRAWGQLSHMAKPRKDEKFLAILAVWDVRRNGGVLEHPRGSKLWLEMDLPKPGEIDEWGGYSICIKQSWFGHKAEKETLLYIVGCPKDQLPAIPISFGAVEYTVSSRIKKKSGRRIKKEITKKEREATPIELAKWLLEVALRSKRINNG
jgi:hypothetical protein